MDNEKDRIYREIFHAQRELLLGTRSNIWLNILCSVALTIFFAGASCIDLLMDDKIVFGVIEAVLVIASVFNGIFAFKQLIAVKREIKREDALYQIELAVREDIEL